MKIVTYPPCELPGRHLDDTRVVSLGDTEMLLVEIHQFHLVVRHLLLVGGLEHEGDVVSLVLGLDGDDIIISSASKRRSLFLYYLEF